MASAKITLIGLYQWDNTLFNNMLLPAGIDKDLLIDSLLLRGGEFEVLYPDAEFMKKSIGIWSSKWYRTFAEWLRGTQATWNPIYNYDRFEESKDNDQKKFNEKTSADYTDSHITDLQDKRITNLKDKRTEDLQDKRTADLKEERLPDLTEKTAFDNSDTTRQTTDGTTEHKVAAYDSSSYSESSKDIINNGANIVDHDGTVTNFTSGNEKTSTTGTDTMNHTGTDITDHTGTDTLNHTGTDKSQRKGTLSDTGGSEENTNIHSAHMFGNIGVTTSAAMLKEFYDISTWNLYEHIADIFTGELLIPVY